MKESLHANGDSSGAERVITGRVCGTDGEPLPGATVNIKGTNIYAVTDLDGNYTIAAKGIKKPVVAITYIGYEPTSKELKSDKAMNFQLEVNSSVLQDVVVVGYGTIKKESVTSAISTVDAKTLSHSTAVNTSGALAGKVSGVNSRLSDGRPGAFTTINIRNMGTPLYVVDGVQMDEGQFNNIDYNDIESISVLKDASAAIYGVRAANGVIVVTTKTGKRNVKSTINVNMYYGWQSLFRYPQPSDASTYVRSQIQSATVSGSSSKYTVDDLAKWTQGTEKGYQSFDWYNYIFTTSPQWYGSASATGGSEKMSYYVAVSHLQQDAIIRNFGNYQRTNMQLNVDANITDKFKLKASINGRVENTSHPGVAMDDDYWTALYATENNLPTQRPFANDNPDYPALTGTAGYTNFAILNYDKSGKVEDRWKVLQANFTGEWEPIKNLKFKGLFSYFYANRRYDNREKGYKLYAYNENSDTYSVVVNSTSSYVERRIENNETLTGQVSANYKNTFKDAHNLEVFVGGESYKTNTPSFYMNGSPASDALKLIYYKEIKTFSDNGNNTQARLGFMGRINYDFKSRYLIEFAARYDGSWKFPPNHRWGFFPSVSAGWRISEENFWTQNNLTDYLQNLKVRVSYGVLGDDNVWGYNAFDYQGGYNYNSGGAVIDGDYVIGSSVRSLPTTNISWLKSKLFDVGVDITTFNNRLSGSIDYFRRLRTGLPASRYDVLLPSEVGFSLPSENLNSDVQKGFDANVMWRDRIGQFNYSVGGNFTLSRTLNWHQYKPKFGNSRDYYVYNSNERYSGQTWGFVCEGQFESWDQIASWPTDIDGKGNSTIRPGDLIYKDTNQDGIITDDDQEPIGYKGYGDTGTPILNYNLNISCSWKGIDFACDFTGASKSTYWFNYENRFPFHGDGNNPQWMLGDQWSLSDITDPNSELIPGKNPMVIAGNSNHSNYQRGSTFWMRNVRYLKLRNLEVGYTFPQKWVNRVKISKLRVYTMMQNLFSWDNLRDRETDPEISNPSGFSYPTNRVFNVGVNLTF